MGVRSLGYQQVTVNCGIDELEKVEGKWLFKIRNYLYLYLDTDPFTGKGIHLTAEISFT